MIIIFKPNFDKNSTIGVRTLATLSELPNVETQFHTTQGKNHEILEAYLIGNTQYISQENLESLPGIAKVIRISDKHTLLGRASPRTPAFSFEYNGLTFSQNDFHLFAGLCAVDNETNVAQSMRLLQSLGLHCTRMGAYKPRTSPYAFQGLGETCLPYVFELAGKYGIKVIAMEVMHEAQIEAIHSTLEKLGHPTGVMLQVGTRNAQNFELLRALGSQRNFPILYKRGFGITLDEALHATEYLAQGGNHKIIFCLRGIKSLLGSPHRNLVDFAHVPVVKRLTRMPVCVDPSHSVGLKDASPEGIPDIFHATAQGVISGANMVLVDVHPHPACAKVDSRQALSLHELAWLVEDIQTTREAYLKRQRIAQSYLEK